MAECSCPGGPGKPLSAAAIAFYAWGTQPGGASQLVISDRTLVQAVAIALAESGGRPGAAGSYISPDGRSHCVYGLWQISDVHPGAQGACDPTTAAKMMWELSHGGLDWSAWSTYGGLRYAGYLPAARLGVAKMHTSVGAGLTRGVQRTVSTGADVVAAAGSMLEAVKAFLSWVMSGSTWIRLGEALGGAILILLALYLLFTRTSAPRAREAA